jgi:hypothetical protein
MAVDCGHAEIVPAQRSDLLPQVFHRQGEVPTWVLGELPPGVERTACAPPVFTGFSTELRHLHFESGPSPARMRTMSSVVCSYTDRRLSIRSLIFLTACITVV